MKLAVIGSGISGLICGYLLGKSHDLTILEADSRPGGHVNTVKVTGQSGIHAVDTGFIVFNRLTYPKFCQLLNNLGVRTKPTRMGFSVSCEASGIEYSGESAGGLLGSIRNLCDPSHWGMVADILRFHRLGQDQAAHPTGEQTVSEYVKRHKLGKRFVSHYLYPLGSALWSCPAEKFGDFPMEFVINFMDNHQMLQARNRPVWRVIEGGSRTYVDRMVETLGSRLRYNSPVQSVKRIHNKVEVIQQNGDAATYDEVILACHADQALKLLKQSSDEETSILKAFPYEANLTTLHSDERLLPKRRSAWASWNARIPAGNQRKATSTYNMNILQGLDDRQQFCVSLNQKDLVDPSLHHSDFNYSHPPYSPGRARAQARHHEFIRRKGISLCGAYWGYGFHEDGITSGLRVCEAFGEGLA